ncbi:MULTISPECIES: phosphoglycolate phosphatase [unclassified Bosea (in: a-proteobacteria)]|uniref:phosphoglycolate phosphatase n=1 Tax=unclassified Bosea (in: a-proteobacteria) TaxID=2653178 RepID=UPI000F7542CC|nr:MULTISPECIES: phosphoglycolate phosphatase [unclassified Bosea (in: a-proteobacteria)]AZO78132.1 phosphoglycolate phosphatase [Bosea sp. Tri-49]RXT20387.1 phosphoglycolate phosphatase [Bosea sp. Tri-39]RXT37259.1 phosphoglycolate phosphatase [Bosea sp. Tri-54]
MSLPPIVVFDLDGTLAETAPDIMHTLNVILEREGLPALPIERARELVGAGARALIERGFKVSGRPLDAEKLEQLFEEFLVIYAGAVAKDSYVHDGVTAALDALAADGFVFAVCTNKPILHTRLILDHFGITGRFAAIAGRDSFPFFKPDPRHLTQTIAEAGADPARAVMVGDSRTDVSTARAAGIPVVCVPFGYTDVPVEALDPDLVIQHFSELPQAVRRLTGGEPALATHS